MKRILTNHSSLWASLVSLIQNIFMAIRQGSLGFSLTVQKLR